MPRYRRQTDPASVQHLISRFVNREFLFDEPGARTAYLERVAAALRRTDWVPLAYALMSSHVHWVVRAGEQPSSAFVKPLHVGFARWLNRHSSRLGPVFADRHRSVTCVGETAAAVVAYVHNNPVRAGVVRDPAASSWTSHRSFAGLEQAPPWLDVEQGLRLCGFAPTADGRQRFDEFVRSRMGEPRSIVLSADELAARRRQARRDATNPVEIAAPTAATDDTGMRLVVAVVVPDVCPERGTWHGGVFDVIDLVARETGIESHRVRSRAGCIRSPPRGGWRSWCGGIL